MKRRFLLVLAALPLAGFAAGPSGKWKGEVTGGDGQTRTLIFNLKTDGARLTGTMTGPQGDDFPIADGKLDGDSLSFSVTIEVGGPVKLLFKGKLAGDEIRFEMQREDGEWQSQFTAKRQ